MQRMKSFFETLFRVGVLCFLVSIPVLGFACLFALHHIQVWANEITYGSTLNAMREIYYGLVVSFPFGFFAISFLVNRGLPESGLRHSQMNGFGVATIYIIFLTIPFAFLTVFRQPSDGFLLTAGAMVGYVLGLGVQFIRRRIVTRDDF